MKVLIDLDRAYASGTITAPQREQLRRAAGSQTAELALNALIGFGIVAVTIGLVVLSGTIASVGLPGAVLLLGGLALVWRGGERWRLLGEIVLVVGAGLLSTGLVILDEGSQRSLLAATAACAVAAIVAENGLLAAAAVLTLSAAIGASTSYAHARYTLVIERPAETVIVFTIIAALLVAASTTIAARFERIALIAARTAALLVNFAFLVGSLWGDSFRGMKIPPAAFSLAWAAALLALAVWAWRANRRWPLVAAIVFAALHFYTQLFEKLGAHAGAILVAGLSTVVVGYGLKRMLAAMPRAA